MSNRPKRPIVTVFGSSQIPDEANLYEEARTLGQAVAQRGYAVCSGGYGGLMEAVSRGAKEAGGHTIGVTVKTFVWGRANPWIDEVIEAPDFITRLRTMTEMGRAYIILPGGIGTLTELGLTWSLLQIGEVHGRPCIVVGEVWAEALAFFRRRLIIREQDFALLRWVASAPEAVSLLPPPNEVRL